MNQEKEQAFWSSVIGFFVVCILGTVCHFVYDLSGSNVIVGFFTPVNESVWEHLKLLFFPYTLYIIGEYAVYGRKLNGFLYDRMLGVVCGMVFIPVMFYLYTALFRRSFVVVDILLFVTAVGLAFGISCRKILRHHGSVRNRTPAAVIVLVGITALFIGFTILPPDTFLFIPPACC